MSIMCTSVPQKTDSPYTQILFSSRIVSLIVFTIKESHVQVLSNFILVYMKFSIKLCFLSFLNYIIFKTNTTKIYFYNFKKISQ